MRFLSNRVKVPRLAEKGEPGEEKWLQLELKLLADGSLGLPNAENPLSCPDFRRQAENCRLSFYHSVT